MAHEHNISQAANKDWEIVYHYFRLFFVFKKCSNKCKNSSQVCLSGSIKECRLFLRVANRSCSQHIFFAPKYFWSRTDYILGTYVT